MIKAAIYDLDDTMVDSLRLHIAAWDELLRKHGLNSDKLPESLNQSFMGMRVKEIAGEILKYFKLDLDVEEFYNERTKIFLKLVKTKLQLLPGVKSTLELFRKNNFEIAIASSATKKYIDIVLEKFHIGDYFDEIICADDVKKGKPDPEVYIVASEKLKLKSEECLVLEDAEKGIIAAKKAGCFCIAIPNIYGVIQDYSKADKIIKSLTKLDQEFLNKLQALASNS